EFAAFPPAAESVALLNAQPDVDLDLELNRGSVHLFNNKPSGPARVRLHCLRETWELTLAEPRAEAWAVLWFVPWGSAAGSKPQVSAQLHLFVRGRANLQAGGQPRQLTGLGHAAWASDRAGPPDVQEARELPECWAKPPDRKRPEVEVA